MAEREYIVTITDEVDKNAFKKFEEQYQAEEFCRCKECKNKIRISNTTGFVVCKYGMRSHQPNWFCADGEKDSEQDE